MSVDVIVGSVIGAGILGGILYFNRINKIKTKQRQNLFLEPSKMEQEQQFRQEGLTDYNDGEPKFGGKRTKTRIKRKIKTKKTKKNKKV
jgi:hypothetical protein